MKRLIFIVVSLVFVSSAKAQFTGNALYNVCTDGEPKHQIMCESWISGFAAGMADAQEEAKLRNVTPTSCLPDSATGNQAMLVVEKYMREHPEWLHVGAGALSGAALRLAFPCSK
jgi:hypothetical protein